MPVPAIRLICPWRIGEFFGEGDELDVLSQQTGQSGAGVTWDDQLQCWVGDAPDVVASLRADRRFRKPVLNTESGYEYLRGHPTEKKQVHHTDKVRRTSGASSARAVTSPLGFTARLATATPGTASTRRTATPSRSRTKAPRVNWERSTTSSLRAFLAAAAL